MFYNSNQMTDPDRREMKKLKAYYDRLGYVADAEYGIPTQCPCGGSIVDEVCAKEGFDTMPGKRFFTCNRFKDDGMHFRQPWVLGVQEEIGRLTKRVEEAEKIQWQVHDIKRENEKFKAEVVLLTSRVIVLEKVSLEASDSADST